MDAARKLTGNYIETIVDGEVLLVDLNGGELFSLDGTAAEVWRRIDGATPLAALAAALEARVLDAVRAVLGHEPDGAGRALVAALRAAVAQVDAPDLEVRVPAAREDVVVAALVDHPHATVVVDPALGPDDAVVAGPAVDVDLRRTRLLAELAAVLDAGEPLGPLAPGEGPDGA